jgi:hypothetical protein
MMGKKNETRTLSSKKKKRLTEMAFFSLDVYIKKQESIEENSMSNELYLA